MKRIRLWTMLAIVTLAASIMPIVAAPPASALVEGCHLIVCIDVYSGGKNYSNHTQWIDSVVVFDGAGSALLEAWGDGFYRSASNTSQKSWYIGRWVRSGTYVCGAATVPGVPRRIACIGISV